MPTTDTRRFAQADADADAAIAAELERRLTLLETEEAADPAHHRLSGRAILVYVFITAGIVVLGAGMLIL